MKQAEFEHIAQQLRAKAVKTARTMRVSDDEAEDIAQESLLKIWSVRNDIRDETHAMKLAACIAKSRAIDSHRRHRGVPINDNAGYIDEKQPMPDASLEDAENIEWLNERLARLPSTEYMILKLRQVEHMTYDEIATTLGTTTATVSTLLSRARKKLLDEIRKRRMTT